MKVRTGYFAKMKKYEYEGYLCVSIAKFPPLWYTGVSTVGLSPSASLLNEYKHGNISEEDYIARYKAELNYNALDAYIKSWETICEEQGYVGVVLLCFEKADSFCHRHTLGKIIVERYGYAVEELVA